MVSNTHKAIAAWSLEQAIKQGCQEARVILYEGSDTEFEVRNEQLDRLQQSTEHQLVIHVFVDGRYGSFSTNRLVKGELGPFIREAVEAVRFLAPDLHRRLPDAARYFSGRGTDLGLFDAGIDSLHPDTKLELARAAAMEVFGQDKRVLSVQANWNDGASSNYLLTSNGFEGEHALSYYALSVTVSVKGNGDARPEAFWYDQALRYDDLIKQGLGKEALSRALGKIGQRKVASGRYTVVVDPQNSVRLLSPLLSALNGAALQQNNSFLREKLGVNLFSDNVTLIDDPHVPRAFGSRWFDNEGVATLKRAVINKGVVETYFLDTYHASKMNLAPTISGPSRLVLEPGINNCEAMVASLEKGLLITGFNGGNCNSSSGDFSFGIEGFLIENGQRTQPVSEMNMTGNMLDLWQQVAEVGNDPRRNNAYQIPSLRFDGVTVSGE